MSSRLLTTLILLAAPFGPTFGLCGGQAPGLAAQDPGSASDGGPVDGDPQEAPGTALPVVTHTLDNGMRFVILPRRGVPTVAFVVRYGVGGVNEQPGHTGVAHVLEHMLFKGTTTVGTTDPLAEADLFARMDAVHDTLAAQADSAAEASRIQELRDRIRELEDSARSYVIPNEFDRILSRNGARGLNATTDNESTTYFVELPANRARLWFVLESDRMSRPVFREFYAERDVVMEERRLRVDTSPGGLLYEAHLAEAFRVHPYRQPVVGYMADLERLDRARVAEYYHRFYGAANAVVAIVGDVAPDTIVSWAEAYFAHLPGGESPPAVREVEPEQRAERRIEVPFDAQPQLRIGWHVGSGLDDDGPTLTMLSYLLSGGRTGRLQRRLVVEDRLAASVSASTGPGVRYPRLFSIQAVPRSPHDAAVVEAAIYEELGRLAEAPPAENELARVRRQLEAGDIRRLASNFGLAFQLAESTALFDDWRATFRRSALIRAVSSQDVQRVVRTYFRPENRTVATLVPTSPAGGER